jgi:hypothetical protein
MVRLDGRIFSSLIDLMFLASGQTKKLCGSQEVESMDLPGNVQSQHRPGI